MLIENALDTNVQAYELLDWIDDVFTFKQFHLTTPIAKIGHVLIMGMVSRIPIGVLKIIGSMWKPWDKIPTSCTNSKSDVYWLAGCHTKSSLLRHQDVLTHWGLNKMAIIVLMKLAMHFVEWRILYFHPNINEILSYLVFYMTLLELKPLNCICYELLWRQMSVSLEEQGCPTVVLNFFVKYILPYYKYWLFINNTQVILYHLDIQQH